MSQIRAIHAIDEAGPVVRCAPDADLDLLLLEVLAEVSDNTDYGYDWDMWAYDEPSAIAHGWEYAIDGATVGWFRMDPCNCGDHGWHLRHLGDERPESNHRRGAWFGVWFQ